MTRLICWGTWGNGSKTHFVFFTLNRMRSSCDAPYTMRPRERFWDTVLGDSIYGLTPQHMNPMHPSQHRSRHAAPLSHGFAGRAHAQRLTNANTTAEAGRVGAENQNTLLHHWLLSSLAPLAAQASSSLFSSMSASSSSSSSFSSSSSSLSGVRTYLRPSSTRVWK